MNKTNLDLLGNLCKSWVSRKRYKSLISKEVNRDKVAKEILDTELIYVKNLETIVSYYLKPLRGLNPPLLSIKSIQIIFGHIEDLLSINKELSISIQDRMTTWYQNKRLGDIFKKLSPYFKLYTEYCSNYDKAISRLKQKTEESKDLAMFLKKMNSENGTGLDLISLLIMPVQRIPRYKLLLQSLIQYTPSESPDYDVLNMALKQITEVADHVNESIREKQNSEKILSIQKRFTGACPPLLAPLRTFIREGYLTKVCRKDHKKRWFILFSDALVYGTKIETAVGNPIYKFHRLLPLNGSKIISNLDDLKFKNSFQIIHSIKSFTLIAENEQEKQSWLKSIEDAQNFLLRNEGSVARMNKQYSKINVLKKEEDTNLASAPVWVPDNEALQCMECQIKFTTIRRRHHCRRCGNVVCGKCSDQKWTLDQNKKDVRVCKSCFNYLSISTSRTAESSISTGSSPQLQSTSSSPTLSSSSANQSDQVLISPPPIIFSNSNDHNIISSDDEEDEDTDSNSMNDSLNDMPVIPNLSAIQINESSNNTNTNTNTNNNNNNNNQSSVPLPPLPTIPPPTRPISPKPESTIMTITPPPTSTSKETTPTTPKEIKKDPPTLSKSNAGNNSLLDFCKAYIQSSPNVSPAKVERQGSSKNVLGGSGGNSAANSPSPSTREQHLSTMSTSSSISTTSNSSISSSVSTSSLSSLNDNNSTVVLPELKPITSDPNIVSITASNSTSSSSIKVNPTSNIPTSSSPSNNNNNNNNINNANNTSTSNSSLKLGVSVLPQTPPPTNSLATSASSPTLNKQTSKSLPPTPPVKALPPTPPTKKLPPTPPSPQPTLHNNNNNNNNIDTPPVVPPRPTSVHPDICTTIPPTNNNNISHTRSQSPTSLVNSYNQPPPPPPKRAHSVFPTQPSNSPYVINQNQPPNYQLQQQQQQQQSDFNQPPPVPPPRIRNQVPPK